MNGPMILENCTKPNQRLKERSPFKKCRIVKIISQPININKLKKTAKNIFSFMLEDFFSFGESNKPISFADTK